MKYRPDVEGLRAVAVLLVVAAHAGVPGFSGGFVGVDMFFVLSGYLITALLVAERERDGRIDYVAFYARRFRRLMPALALMLVVCSLGAWALIPSFDQPGQALAGVTASLWLSNLHFAFGDLDYFAPSVKGNIFLHTWSLGVEEQFYLVWPALVAGALAFGAGGRRRLGWLMGGVALASLLACLLLTPVAPQHAFYQMPLRAWQFASGALVFLALGPGNLERDGSTAPKWAWGLTVAGVALLALSIHLIDDGRAYPGAWALMPTLATCMVIAAGTAAPRGILAGVLSSRLMQAVGRRSYSWYLWHWPALVLGSHVLPIDAPWARAGLVAMSFLMASASYRWVETPVRRDDQLLRVPRRAVAGAIVVMAVMAAGGLHWLKFSVNQPAVDARETVTLPVIYGLGCDEWFSSADLKPCVFGEAEQGGRLLVIGDSIGLHWFPAIHKMAEERGMQLVVLTKSACPVVDVDFIYPRIGRVYTECTQWREAALEFAKSYRPDLLVLGSSDTYAFTEDQWKDGSARIVDAVAGAAGRVAVLRSTPRLPFDGPGCMAHRGWLHSALEHPARCTSSSRDARGEAVARWLKDVASRHANVSFVDLNDLVCPEGRCQAVRNGILAFRDTQHLNAAFAETLSAEVAARLDALPGSP